MPLAKIEGEYWVVDSFKKSNGVIVWPDPSIDSIVQFDGNTPCCFGIKHHPPTREQGRALSGSEAALGFVALTCLKCYGYLKPLKIQLKNWDQQTIKVVAGNSLTT